MEDMYDDVDRIYWCTECFELAVNAAGELCHLCGIRLKPIGFTKDFTKPKRSNLGGRLTPGNCGCGNPLALKGIDDQGRKKYRTNCTDCLRKGRKNKTDTCNICKVKMVNPKDLDVDHIDGNRSNNDPSNLQTLCKPCHNKKTKENKDWKRKK
jgi:5-methylcytosine-specific restriction endonuclease McrA